MTLSTTERLYRRLTKHLPASLSAQLDWLRTSYHVGWGGAMNGQSRRQMLIVDLLRRVEPVAIVETGSFRGATSRWLHEVSDLPVYTVESDVRFFKFAQRACTEAPGVSLTLGDSRALIARLVDEGRVQRTFFYLDAHWNDDVPRFEELVAIMRHWPSALVVIDDFQVPGDAGYGFAMYGDSPLDERYLPDLAEWALFYPRIPSSEETGARRGCAVLASPDLIPLLQLEPDLLRRK